MDEVGIALGSTRSYSRLDGVRERERSTSLTESTPYHPSVVRPTDWLGPRTAKAFAAAGLLDRPEKDGSVAAASRPGSRFSATTRSDRDMRSQYAPSRTGFSDIVSRASWGRRSGSISRTATSSEILSSHGESGTASTPRTTFSAASTAPTSISAVSSSSQKYLQSEIQVLQDKHALETGALLNALADSQRTTRLLRDENTQLRDQMQQLEDRLADALEDLRRIQLAPPPKLPRTNFYRMPGAVSEFGRRPLPQSRLQTLAHPEPEPESADSHDTDTAPPYNRLNVPTYETEPMPPPSPKFSHARNDSYSSYSDAHKRRHSASSSIFPVLPSNMSMLLQDEGADTRSTRSASPAPTIPGPSFDIYHKAQVSVGNISPTTANFSIVTGSPGSLNLRPEHERLLEDMPPLDLCADYETDGYDDHGR